MKKEWEGAIAGSERENEKKEGGGGGRRRRLKLQKEGMGRI